MTTSTPSSSLPDLGDDAAAFARRLGLISAGLAALVARRFLRMPHLVGLTVLLWTRITRVLWRFERLMVRAARVGPVRVRALRVRTLRTGRGDGGRTAQVGLPSERGWLVRELGWEAAAYLGQLEALLADRAMRAVLASLPGAGQVLRPLCRMLGVPAAAIAPAVVVVAAAAAVPIAMVGPCVAQGGLPGIVGESEGIVEK